MRRRSSAGGSTTRHQRLLFPGRPRICGEAEAGKHKHSHGLTLAGHSLTLAGHARACLKAGWDPQRAAGGSWSRSMRKRKQPWVKKRENQRRGLLPPHSISMDSPLCLRPIIQQLPALGRGSSIHQRLLSVFAAFQNLPLVPLSVFMSVSAAEGDL